jgi:hypothetical protein
MPTLKENIRKHFLLFALFLSIALLIIWYGVKLISIKKSVNETFNVSLARDTRTDEYLGEVISERKDPVNNKVTSYQIKRNDGNIIERSPESVTVFRP